MPSRNCNNPGRRESVAQEAEKEAGQLAAHHGGVTQPEPHVRFDDQPRLPVPRKCAATLSIYTHEVPLGEGEVQERCRAWQSPCVNASPLSPPTASHHRVPVAAQGYSAASKPWTRFSKEHPVPREATWHQQGSKQGMNPIPCCALDYTRAITEHISNHPIKPLKNSMATSPSFT